MIILGSFFLPQLVMQLEQNKIFAQSYLVEKEMPKLTWDVPNGKLVPVIYSRYQNNQKYQVSCTDEYQEIEDGVLMSVGDEEQELQILDSSKVLAELQQLAQMQLLKKEFLTKLACESALIYRTWEYDNGEITYAKTKIFTSQDNFHTAVATVEIEHVTNKILSITMEQSYLLICQKSLQNYVEYLELGDYKDWKETEWSKRDATTNQEDGSLEYQSKNGQIKIVVTQENGKITLKAVPLSYTSVRTE